MDIYGFKEWLAENTEFKKTTKSNIVSRLKRADDILPLKEEQIYLFNLSQEKEFQSLTVSVKSQVRRAIKLYFQYLEWKLGATNAKSKKD